MSNIDDKMLREIIKAMRLREAAEAPPEVVEFDPPLMRRSSAKDSARRRIVKQKMRQAPAATRDVPRYKVAAVIGGDRPYYAQPDYNQEATMQLQDNTGNGAGKNEARPNRNKPTASIERKRRGDSATGDALYAVAQMKRDVPEKEVLAEYVMRELPLDDGLGLIIDAGSTCLKLWQSVVKRICENELHHLVVYTNNYSVLEYWIKCIAKLSVRETSVHVIGNELDPSHLAFHGTSTREWENLTSGRVFRAAHIYVGTSGIGFDKDGICISYHAAWERDSKQLLFQCPARRRIILATSAKIGFTGGRVFDLLSVQDMDHSPIHLVTTRPAPGSEQEPEFEAAKAMFRSEQMKKRVSQTHPNLEIYWEIIDPASGAFIETLSLNGSEARDFHA